MLLHTVLPTYGFEKKPNVFENVLRKREVCYLVIIHYALNLFKDNGCYTNLYSCQSVDYLAAPPGTG